MGIMNLCKRLLPSILAVLLLAGPALALVHYEKGRLELNGILLLQDYEDSKVYYYVPPYPRIGEKKTGELELSCVKFVDPEGDVDGGLLHLLVEFSLPDDELAALRDALAKEKPGAELRGPVALMAETKEEEDQTSFKVVSAVLSDTKEGGFTKSVITSGRAPLTPGSKAAVAAILDKHGATLLWESLSRPTSDISITIRAYYEAALPSYKARIHADISTIYKHFSSVINKQEGYTKRQLRQIVDDMRRQGLIEIEIFERSIAGNAQVMEGLVNLASDKLISMIFDTTTGLSKLPEQEQAVEKGQLAGRQKKGWLAKLFTSSGNQKYYSDDQYVMKDRQDIKQSVFSINLTKNASIRVPIDSSGNMSGIYAVYKDNPDYFRVVNLKDPSFQKRQIYFKLDGEYVGSFERILNFAAVNFKKDQAGQPASTAELVFTKEDVKNGEMIKAVQYPRLGAKGESWLDYEFQTSWSVRGRDAIRVPAGRDEWLTNNAPIITLNPPFEKMEVEVDADRYDFEDNNIKSGVVEFRYPLFGKTKEERKAVLRAQDSEQSRLLTLYRDPGQAVQYRVTWYAKRGGGKVSDGWQLLDSTYLSLSPPSMGQPEASGGGGGSLKGW